MKFLQKLEKRVKCSQSLLCVGLDPVLEKIPSQFLSKRDPFFAFGKWIIDQTHKYVCAFKPNSAFYESLGTRGIQSLKKTCDYIRIKHPTIPIILDAKRGDIGHTNTAYAQFVFDYLQADAITLQPYMGSEALSEFFRYEKKGLIVLCKTSNPGAGEFQDLLVADHSGDLSKPSTSNFPIPLWEKIATTVTTNWQKKSKADLLLVIGATYPDELKIARKIAPLTTFLVPGVGRQGGDLKKIIQVGQNMKGRGIIINSSREVIYSDDPKRAIQQMWKNVLEFS